jgi:hypothetical protein
MMFPFYGEADGCSAMVEIRVPARASPPHSQCVSRRGRNIEVYANPLSCRSVFLNLTVDVLS